MHTLIDHNKKILIFWSAKCACTTLKLMFDWYTRWKDVPTNPSDIHTIRLGNEEQMYVIYGILKPEEFYGPFKDYKRILVIRNPYKRFLSCAIAYINGNSKEKKNLTYNEYLNKVFTQKFFHKDHHLIPQTSGSGWIFLKRINKRIDEIYTTSELDKLNERLHNLFPERKLFELKNYNSWNPPPEKQIKKVFYTSEVKKAIHYAYKQDFEFFKSLGYDFDIDENYVKN